MASSRIKDLASVVMARTTRFEELLALHKLPSPSFDPSTFATLPPSEELQQAQTAIVEAISELQALVLGPIGMLRTNALSYIDLISLQAICHFGIAQSFSEEASYTQISQTCRLDEQTLRRIMRHAMASYIFKEHNNVITHTAASKLLNENPLMRAWVGMICEESWPAAALTVDALDRWPGSQEPEHTGFALAKNTSVPFFVELEKSPTRAKRFADAMSMFESGHGSAISALVNHYAWGAIGKGTLVDVGGSHGSRSIAIAENYPSLHCIVLDLPKVVADGPSKVPSDLKSRVTFAAHDFFTEPPEVAKAADVYLFCRIFHNWSDKYAIKILRSLVPALKYGARILISDICLPEPHAIPSTLEKKMRSSDLGMMAMLNARERGRDDWAELFREADERFHFIGVQEPPGSQLAFIEAAWKGHDLS
ncbi:hypothetical protein MMC27_005952 [Xylographa pallens]|nr:hypothetical protein [Xylographa pallens]